MFENALQPTHLILIFVIVMLVFGPQKLPQLGKGLGEAIRGFREGLHAAPSNPPVTGASEPQAPLPAAKDDAARVS